jgi:two-component system, response regulator YesN
MNLRVKGEVIVNHYHVLIVDDEVHSIRGVQAGIEWESHHISEVYTANNVNKAQEVFQNYKVDLLLCDIEMPKGSGLDLVKWVKEHYPNTETIFLTCHSDFSYAKQALQLQSYNYLLKPVDYQELGEVIDGAIEKIKKHQEMREVEQSYHQLQHLAMVERFWSDVISKVIPPSLEKIEANMKIRGITFPAYTTFIPILVHIQRWKEKLTVQEESIMEYALQKVIDEAVISNYKGAHQLSVETGVKVVIFPSTNAFNRGELLQNSNDFISKFSQFFLCDLCCYMGKQVPIDELADMVQELKELQQNNVTIKNKTIEYTGRRKKGTIPVLPYEEWGQLLSNGDKDNLIQKLNGYFSNWEKDDEHTTAHSLHYFYQDYLQLIFYVLKVKGIQANQVFAQNLLTEKPERVLTSLTSLHEWVIYITEIAMNQLHSSREKSSVIDLVKQFISENIGEHQLSRELIANHVYLNPDYLTRIFKKQTGLPISDYLIQQRMDYAKKLLRDTEFSISEIALSVGYSNFSYFSTLFKKTTQKNPKEYRELSKKRIGRNSES